MTSPRLPLRRAAAYRIAVAAILSAAAFGLTYPYPPGVGKAATTTNATDGMLVGPFIFTPSVYTDLTYDDNIFRVEDGFMVDVDPDHDGTLSTVTQHSQGDVISTSRANLALKLPFSHSFVSLSYQPQYRRYQDLNAPLKYSHQIQFDSALNFASGSSITLKDERSNGFFQARRLDAEALFQLNSTPYHRDKATLAYDWSFADAWGFAGRVERTKFNYDATQVVNFSDTATGTSGSDRRLFDFFDYVTRSFVAGAYRNFSRLQVFLEGTLSRTDQDRTKFNVSQFKAAGCEGSTPTDPAECARLASLIDTERINQKDAAVGVRGYLTALTQGDIRAAYTGWSFRSGSPKAFQGISVEGNLVHNFTRRTVASVNLQRSPVQATGQYTGYYIREEASVSLEHKLTTRLSTRGRLAYRRSRFPGAPELLSPRFSLTDYEASLEMRYRPGSASRPGPLLLVVGVAPTRSTSSLRDAGLNVSSRRATMSLQYGWF